MRNHGRGPGAARPGAHRPGAPGARSPRRGSGPEPGPPPRRGPAGWPAADLGAIRRSEEVIDMLAGRAVPAAALSDPAVALLEQPQRRHRWHRRGGGWPAPAGWRPVPRHRAGRARPAGTWPHAGRRGRRGSGDRYAHRGGRRHADDRRHVRPDGRGPRSCPSAPLLTPPRSCCRQVIIAVTAALGPAPTRAGRPGYRCDVRCWPLHRRAPGLTLSRLWGFRLLAEKVP